MEQKFSASLSSGQFATCPSCGSTGVSETWIDDEFEYGSGEDAVKLSARLPLCYCTNCELSFTDWRGEELRHEAVCNHLNILTPAEIAAIRERNDLTQQEFADLSGIGRASLARWETGAVFQNSSSDSLLRLLCFSDNIERLRARTTKKQPPLASSGGHQRFRGLSEQKVTVHRKASASFYLYLDS